MPQPTNELEVLITENEKLKAELAASREELAVLNTRVCDLEDQLQAHKSALVSSSRRQMLYEAE